ncbi:MAG: esterase family protein [Clostridia bacterium]|nr:esterase family protein [Clostridia bacterium]
MALIHMHFYSAALGSAEEVNIILPENSKGAQPLGAPAETCKTLWLLHGLNGDHNSWIRETAIERYLKDGGYNIAVVMPNVNRSWYTDTCDNVKYFTYITEELPAILRSYFKCMTDKREDNYIAGLSMGGYGAVKAALTYPERYAAFASLSGSLDITRRGRSINIPEWRRVFKAGLQSGEELDKTPHDLFWLAEKNINAGVSLPRYYQWCGVDDELIKVNRRFHEHLTRLGFDHVCEEGPGDHTWKWWDEHIIDVLRFMFSE